MLSTVTKLSLASFRTQKMVVSSKSQIFSRGFAQPKEEATEKKGFAAMPHEKVQEIGRMGGKASHKDQEKIKNYEKFQGREEDKNFAKEELEDRVFKNQQKLHHQDQPEEIHETGGEGRHVPHPVRDMAGDSRGMSNEKTDNPLGLEEDVHVPGYVNTSRSHNPTKQYIHSEHNEQQYENESTKIEDHLKYMHQHEDEIQQHQQHNGGHAKGTQGFASMPQEKVEEIASMGGKSSHKSSNPSHQQENKQTERQTKKQEHDQTQTQSHKGKQGFASMTHEQVQEIGSMGGKASHKNTNSNSSHQSNQSNQAEGRSTEGQVKRQGQDHQQTKSQAQTHGKQGFASMPHEQVQEIASMGGKASHSNKNETKQSQSQSQSSSQQSQSHQANMTKSQMEKQMDTPEAKEQILNNVK